MRLVAAALATSALALASCGGDGEPEPPREPPAELLRTAAANPPASGEAELALDAVLEGDSLLAGRAGVALQGTFARRPGGGLARFDLALDGELAGFGVDGAVVSTGEDVYVVFFGENYRLGPERAEALERSLDDASPQGIAGLGLLFADWLRDPRYGEVEEIAGEHAVRIEGRLDAAAMAEDLGQLGASLGAPSLLAELAAGARSGPAEAWIGLDSHALLGVRAQFPFRVPAERRAATGGVESGVAVLESRVTKTGITPSFEPPPGGGFQPIDDLTGRLQSLAGLAF